MDRLASASRRSAVVATAIIALVGLLAGAVRVLPWLLDPAVPWHIAEPFARGVAAVSLEAALLVGWPLGWALACFRLAETGEARVLETLGRSPHETAARLVPHGIPFAVALAAVALVYGNDASAPGRVATELVARGQASCAAAKTPVTYSIPFTDMTWLCAPDREPRLVGSGPGAMSSVVLSARMARIAGDFRALELDDARVLIPGPQPIAVHVGSLAMHGMAPWARSSALSAPLRAAVLGAAAWLAAVLAAYATLRRPLAARTRASVLALGAAGPIAALGLMRLLERADARPLYFALVPLAPALGLGAVLVAALVFSRLPRLRGRRGAASTRVKV